MNNPGATITKGFYSPLCILIVILTFCFCAGAPAQNPLINGDYWSDDNTASTRARSKLRIRTQSARALNLEFGAFSQEMAMIEKVRPGSLGQQGTVIALPMPDGTFERYKVAASPIMADELAQKFPQIKTYAGQGADDGTATIRLDITPQGFHAIIFKSDEVIYIDPAYANNTTNYIAYYKKDFIRPSPVFSGKSDVKYGKGENGFKEKNTVKRSGSARSSGGELREYRLAVATTGEYTDFHGGTVANSLAAIVTTMNRVNGIFEREVAIRMVLIGNNDQIIYTNPGTDPYTNSEPSLLIDENQANLDNVIGPANYDIGHVFSTASGGMAYVGGVCNDNTKGQGNTGIATPIGDPFDVDFVSHEIGHQFGAEHTFNGTAGNCNAITRSSLVSFEPGSGTTIMGYAGICSPQNIQINSDDYFHTASYDQILDYISGTGGNCPSTLPTGNTPPTVNAGDDFFIPVNTPFTLTGSANDDDGDALTYCWEQYDLGPAGPPNDPNTTGPLFRSFPPVTSPSRTFPQLSDILNNTPTLGEILPAITRTMEFRLTVRDNKSNGGGVNYDDLTINVVDLAGKFEVTSLNAGETVESGIPTNISWQVADTDQPPINTSSVNIYLSTDGGMTFPVLLAENVENDGLEAVLFPDNATDQARIKIEAVGNIYFDINDQDFSIEIPDTPGFAMVVDPISPQICTPAAVEFSIDIIPVLDFNDQVDLAINNLPPGVEASFSDNPVIPGNPVTMTLTNTEEAGVGQYLIELTSSSGALNQQQEIELTILNGDPPGPALTFPANGATDVPLIPFLSWADDLQMNAYTFELALDPDFNNIVDSIFDLSDAFYQETNRLESNVTYYWRVKGVNNCGPGQYSETFSFTTLLINYFTFESTDVPKTIDASAPGMVVSTLQIEIVDDLVISDINVVDLKGMHSFISDLTFTLKSPVGTEVVLFANICFNEDNFDLSLDDESTNNDIPCPPADGGSYRPSGSLSDFNGQNAKGIWTLTVADNAIQDGGVLDSWGLEIGTDESRPRAPLNLQATPASVNTIAIAWEDNSNNEDNFILERSTFNNSNFEEIANLSANTESFDDSGLMDETIYVYRIKAVNEFGASAYSQEVETAGLPIAPGNLRASAGAANQINLSWLDLSATEDSYVVEQSVGDNMNFVEIATVDANSQNYQATNLQEEVTYYFRLFAQNQYGRSALSEEVSATTLVLGIEGEVAKNISVFPNPTENNLVIKVEKASLLITGIRLTDIRGSAVYVLGQEDIKMREGQLTLEINNRAKGLYLLEITTEKAKVIKRIIKK